MSASEKLRALGEPWAKDEDTYPEDGSVGRVMDALPQIVAVVEAAEHAQKTRHFLDLTDREFEKAITKYDAALAALEEALK